MLPTISLASILSSPTKEARIFVDKRCQVEQMSKYNLRAENISTF
jgi:hypothetical protein